MITTIVASVRGRTAGFLSAYRYSASPFGLMLLARRGGGRSDDIRFLKTHRGPCKNASNYTQYAKRPHGPSGYIRGGESKEFSEPR